MKIHNLKRRIGKIEDQCGISQNDEIVEIPLDSGQIFRITQRGLNEFVDWLKGRENNGQDAIEMNETERN